MRTALRFEEMESRVVPSRTWYVSPTGVDSYTATSGTISEPVATIGSIVWRLSPGDEVHFRGGTYTPTVPLQLYTAGTAATAGSPAVPIKVMAQPGETVVIDGSQLPITATEVISVTAHDVEVSGFRVVNSPRTGIAVWGAKDVAILNNTVTDSKGSGIYVGYDKAGYVSGVTISGNTVTHNSLSNSARTATGGWKAAVVAQFTSGVQIVGNTVFKNYGEGFDILQSDGASVRRNVAYDNYSVNYYLDNATNTVVDANLSYTTNDGGYYRFNQPAVGVQLANETYAVQTPIDGDRITNNILLGGRIGFSYGNYDTGGGLKNVLVAGNTIYGSTNASMRIEAAAHAGTTIENNIVEQHAGYAMVDYDGTTGSGGLSFATNLWYGMVPELGGTAGDVTTDPRFVAPGGTDPAGYRLRSDSPAINRGTFTAFAATDYFGVVRPPATFDIGASEFDAGIGGPYMVGENSTVTLRGTLASDAPAGAMLSWDLDGDGIFGETGAAAMRGAETGANPTFLPPSVTADTTFTIQLRVTTSGGTILDTVGTTITVGNADPTQTPTPLTGEIRAPQADWGAVYIPWEYVRTAANSAGRKVIVWDPYTGSSIAGPTGVQARVFDANNTPLTNEFPVQTLAGGAHVTSASVAMWENGNFVVTWQTWGGDAEGWGIRARVFDPVGTPITGDFLVNTSVQSNYQSEAVVTILRNGNFVVIWTDPSGSDGSGYTTWAKVFDPSGGVVKNDFIANEIVVGDQYGSGVAAAPNGQFLIGYTSDGGNEDVFVRRFSASGSALGSSIRINTTTASNQARPRTAVAPDGKYLVTWFSSDQDGSGAGIYAQLMSATDQLIGGEFRLNSYTLGNQTVSDVAVDANGEFVVVWQSLSQDENGNYGIYAQRISADGMPIGGEFRVNTTTYDHQWGGSVDFGRPGELVFGWQSLGQANGNSSVYFRTFGTAPTPSVVSVGENAIAVVSTSTANGPVTITTAAPHGLRAGGAVVIAGNSNASYNGTFTIGAVVDATHFTLAVVGPMGSGTGGIAAAVPSAGFTASRILSLAVHFNTAVTVAAGAFTLSNGTDTIRNEAQGAIVASGSGTASIMLTFTGTTGVEGFSLKDGIWTLTIDGSLVTNAAGSAMAGAYVRGNIRRLFGTSNGDAAVDSTDSIAFGNTYGLSSNNVGFDSAFDSNGDGTIDSTDSIAFGNHYGLGL